MRTIHFSHVFLLLAASLLVATQAAEPNWAVQPAVPSVQQLVPPGAVRLLEGPFKTMQDADHAYLMRLEPDRLLAQFRVEAGLEPKAKPYPLDKCLVTDEKFEGSGMKPYELVVDGQTVKLCCKSCLKDFNKEKVSFMKKLSEEAGKKPKSK